MKFVAQEITESSKEDVSFAFLFGQRIRIITVFIFIFLRGENSFFKEDSELPEEHVHLGLISVGKSRDVNRLSVKLCGKDV